jgi:hypothetical protein
MHCLWSIQFSIRFILEEHENKISRILIIYIRKADSKCSALSPCNENDMTYVLVVTT